MSTSVVVFTRDLRVHDQPALAEAAATSELVVPLFVLDDAIVRLASPNRLAFLLDALEDLRLSLRARGADLVVRRGDPAAETMRVARKVQASRVFVGEDASAYAAAREGRLAAACGAERIELRVVNATSVVPPGDVTPAGRDHYRVFTPYWRRWQAVPLRAPLPAPRRLQLPAELRPGTVPALRGLTSAAPSPGLPTGGERAGRRRLGTWLRSLGGPVPELEPNGSSRLSPHFHFGCVSAAEAVARLRAHPHGAEFVRQLCWRDFFQQLLAANSRTPREDLRPRGDQWRDDPEAFARWSEGTTGYPIVDAAMRQLAQEGFMPNRARLVVASFLTKTLYIDWRPGAEVFSRLLVDADLASNVGNWQWVAGTGVDTRPNRVLDPIAQAKRFDPEGSYVRRYVPELAHVEGSRVHMPGQVSGYPDPIVDHARAAARFRAARA
jgi:deoxyribodipyrimidine photo-lyase